MRKELLDGLLDADKYTGYDSSPVAGWNICSRNLKEEGFFETVCMFDGDVFIEGLPYRTDELEDGGSLFGGSLSFDLFEGLWELRIAFSGFSWSYDGAEVPIAFPAVRGEICIEGNDGDDDMPPLEYVGGAKDESEVLRAGDLVVLQGEKFLNN